MSRLAYSDLSESSMQHIDNSEKTQVLSLLKRFSVESDLVSAKGKGKRKEKDKNSDIHNENAAQSRQMSLFEQQLSGAFFDTQFTDVDMISCEGDRIPCHLIVICSQSEVFRAMMTIGMLESRKSEISILNAKTETLKKVRAFTFLLSQ